jgi:hypothetical protein
VLGGEALLALLEAQGTEDGDPLSEVLVTGCGVLA